MAPRRPQPQSRERRKFVRPSGSACRSRRTIGVWPTYAGPAGAGQGRQPAEPDAQSASLDRRRLVRQRLARPNGAATPNRAASLAHCADMLSAKENPNSCKVRPCQKSCDKSLHSHTIDRGAPWALYPAIKRSVVCAWPVLRYSSPNRDRTKTRTSRTRPGSARISSVSAAPLSALRSAVVNLE